MKLWKRILLRVPKAGLAYRAYRWFRFVRRRKLIKLTRLARKLRKAFEENPDMAIKALKSKMVWLGIVQVLYGIFELWASGGAITMEVVTSGLAGIMTIALRAVTTQPLSEK